MDRKGVKALSGRVGNRERMALSARLEYPARVGQRVTTGRLARRVRKVRKAGPALPARH